MTFLGIRQKVVGISDEIPTNFFFPTKRYRRTGSSEIRRNRPIPTNFRRFRPSESPCFLVVGGKEDDKQLMTYILANSNCLKTVDIKLIPTCNLEECQKELESMPRISPSSRLLYSLERPEVFRWTSRGQWCFPLSIIIVSLLSKVVMRICIERHILSFQLQHKAYLCL
ncbi:hypothetical protein YC2023_017546 [Brassica napus]